MVDQSISFLRMVKYLVAHDEYMLLKLYKKKLIFDFYKESEKLLLKKMIIMIPIFLNLKIL